MKKYIILFLCFLGVWWKANATHIVGGELEMVHLQGDDYRIGLILYFDAINGNVDAIDPNVRIHIFSKSTNRHIQTIEAPLLSNTYVNYTQPACTVGSLSTRRIYYARQVTLNRNFYADAGGYYMTWERCCRNKTIANIEAPESSGQTFYLEFPALLSGRNAFINSSPNIFPPVSDYACVNLPFYFNFGGTDKDGDKLVYRLTTPINGFSNPDTPLPINPNPAPYPLVDFISGIGVGNMIPGNPALTIDANRGILRLTASEAGLYVFAVVCEEYRNSTKIGEVRREFQLMVLNCPSANPPSAQYLPNGQSNFYQEGTTLSYFTDEEKCGEVYVKDVDLNTKIIAYVEPINFNGGVSIEQTGTINGANDVLKLDMCFPDCPNPSGQPYEMNVIVGDNSCAVPLLDTIRVKVDIKNRPNLAPTVSVNLPKDPSNPSCYAATVLVGESLKFDVIGDDGNNDELVLSGEGLINGLGMNFPTKTGRPKLVSTFSWNPKCDALNEGEKERTYNLKFKVKDQRKCGEVSKESEICVKVTLKSRPAENTKPDLTASLPLDNEGFYYDTVSVGETISFDLLGKDADGDTLLFSAKGVNFDMSKRAISYAPKKGKSPLQADVNWKTSCKDLSDATKAETFYVDFYVQDTDPCGNTINADTIHTRFVLKPVQNIAPTLTTDITDFDAQTNTFYDTLVLGETLKFNVIGNDANADTLQISGKGIGFNFSDLGMSFSTVTGVPTLNAPFTWATNCALGDKIKMNTPYSLQFLVKDLKACEPSKYDTVQVKLVVLPPNHDNTTPDISTSLDFDATLNMYVDTIEVGSVLNFDVIGKDVDKDSIFVSGEGVGFSFSQYGISFANKAGVEKVVSPLRWQTRCDILKDITKSQNFKMRFIVYDKNGCDTKTYDTTFVQITVTPIKNPNTAPVVSTTLPFNATTGMYEKVVLVGKSEDFNVIVNDAQSDSVSLWAKGVGFNLGDFNMKFTDKNGYVPLSSPFHWQTLCDYLNNPKQTFEKDFFIDFFAKDYKACQVEKMDTIRVKLTLRYTSQPNTAPTLSADLSYNNTEKVYVKKATVGENANFWITADDREKSDLILYAQGVGFNLADLGMNFPATMYGAAPLKGEFTWLPTCANLGENASNKSYYVDFFTQDLNYCADDLIDTIRVRIEVSPNHQNTPPSLEVSDLEYDAASATYFKTVHIEETIRFTLTANDADKDKVFISGKGVGFNFTDMRMQFTPVEGLPIQETTFEWSPDCEILGGSFEKSFDMLFYANEESQCGKSGETPIKVRLMLKDNEETTSFLPPNVFTPNNDGKNDTFSMPTLPINTCKNTFEKIIIYNRLGQLMYESTERNFDWDGKNAPTGVYYYLLKFTNKEYKGTVSILGKE